MNPSNRTSASARFDKLFFDRPKPSPPSAGHLPTVEQGTDQHQTAAKSEQFPPHATERVSDDQKVQQFTVSLPERLVQKQKFPKNLDKHVVAAPQCPQPIQYLPYGKSSTDNVQDPQNVTERLSFHTEPVTDPEAGLARKYCLFLQLVKFPYKYLVDNTDAVSQRFFAREQIYHRGFCLYYLWPPASITDVPVLLTPYDQVKELTDLISAEFKVDVEVPPFPFTLTFRNDGTPQPAYLGVVGRKSDVADLMDMIPAPPVFHGECPPQSDERTQKSFAIFHEKIKRALAVNKKQGGNSKRKTEKRTALIIDGINQLNRVQRYFGLRSRIQMPVMPQQDLPFDQHATFEHAEMKRCGMIPDPLDVTKIAPYNFEGRPIMISIDVESWEENHTLITEVGISTLDTEDLVELAPGNAGCNWLAKIRSRHFRLKGRENLVNHKFCQGNPTSFRFGQSEFITLDEAADVIDSCFEEPFSAAFESAGAPELDEWGTRPEGASKHNVLPKPAARPERKPGDKDTDQDPSTRRNLLIVGHDLQGDLDSLSILGSNIFGPPSASYAHEPNHFSQCRGAILASILEALDTATLYKNYTKTAQTQALAAMCTSLDITPWYAHNAGNDARYTLECLVKLAIKARLDEDRDDAKTDLSHGLGMQQTLWELEKQHRTDQKMELTRQRINKDLREHETAATPVNMAPYMHRTAESTSSGVNVLNTDCAGVTTSLEGSVDAFDKERAAKASTELDWGPSRTVDDDGDFESEDWYPY